MSDSIKSFYRCVIMILLKFSAIAVFSCVHVACGPRADPPPSFPVIGAEYELTVVKRDYEDRDDYEGPGKPFNDPTPQVLFLDWMGGSWYEVAYPHKKGSGYLLTTYLNLSEIFTLTRLPDSQCWIRQKFDQQQDDESDPTAVVVIGQVAKPGKVSIPDGRTTIEILEAVAACGDFKGIADTRNVLVKQGTDKGTGLTRVNVRDLLRARDRGEGGMIYLQAGDAVIVSQRVFD